MKSSPSQQPKFVLLGMECLHTSHVGRHQPNGGFEDALIEGVEIAFLNEQGADFLQSPRAVRSNSCVAVVTLRSAAGDCGRNETFQGRIVVRERHASAAPCLESWL